jgi:hypothetical protein
MNMIHLAQDGDKRGVLLDTVMKSWFHDICIIFEQLRNCLYSQAGLRYMELIISALCISRQICSWSPNEELCYEDV